MLNIQLEKYHLKNEQLIHFNNSNKKYSILSDQTFGIGSIVVRGLV